ncbi:hypothetical protein DINM_006088 [Dirofilaria immitis]|nr:hypothetical protein [Dirofilaria immitis]
MILEWPEEIANQQHHFLQMCSAKSVRWAYRASFGLSNDIVIKIVSLCAPIWTIYAYKYDLQMRLAKTDHEKQLFETNFYQLEDGAQVIVAKKVKGMKSEAREFLILIMWLFGVPKSSITVIIIAILLFAEMNSIASLKSFNNSEAHLNSSSANGKCCPNITRERIRKATFGNGVADIKYQYKYISSASSGLAANGAAVIISALSAGLFAV